MSELMRVKVPNRLNYLLWIQSLLSNTGGGFADEYEDEREVLGIDVGTGASCVYPLLGCALHLRWRFVGTGEFRFNFHLLLLQG